MKIIGKMLGVFILVAAGIPLLVAALWAASLTGAVRGTDFLGEMAQEVVKRLPGLVEGSLEAARQPGAVSDPDAKAWIEATGKVAVPPSRMLEKTGISWWLEGEVARVFGELGGVLRGEREPEKLSVDLRPLKKALSRPEVQAYLGELLSQLPPCDQAGLGLWKQRVLAERRVGPLPACNPAKAVTEGGSSLVVATAIAEIPDEALVFGTQTAYPAVEAVRTVDAFLWLLYLLPVLLVGGGAALAGGGTRGCLALAGGTILAGSLVSLLLSVLASTWLLSLVHWVPDHWHPGTEAVLWTTQAGRLFVAQLGDTLRVVLEGLFTPVFRLSLLAGVAGAVLVALSFLSVGESSASEAG